jgi:acetyl-CoA carboxylase biotin carboxyl carrier protein
MPLNPPDIKELRAIIDWVNLTEDVRELSIKFGDVELHISRDGSGRAASTPAAPSLAAPAPATASPTPQPAAPQATAAAAAATPASSSGTISADTLAADEVLIKAPMVGVFYSSPKPGDPPFVVVGASVTATTVVGIVEVMKLMNNLEAKVDGTISRILVENEHAVEFNQPLMVIKRNA